MLIALWPQICFAALMVSIMTLSIHCHRVSFIMEYIKGQQMKQSTLTGYDRSRQHFSYSSSVSAIDCLDVCLNLTPSDVKAVSDPDSAVSPSSWDRQLSFLFRLVNVSDEDSTTPSVSPSSEGELHTSQPHYLSNSLIAFWFVNYKSREKFRSVWQKLSRDGIIMEWQQAVTCLC